MSAASSPLAAYGKKARSSEVTAHHYMAETDASMDSCNSSTYELKSKEFKSSANDMDHGARRKSTDQSKCNRI